MWILHSRVGESWAVFGIWPQPHIFGSGPHPMAPINIPLEEPYHTYLSIGHSPTRIITGHIFTLLEPQDRRLSILSAVAVRGECEPPIYLSAISRADVCPFRSSCAPQDDPHLESFTQIYRSCSIQFSSSPVLSLTYEEYLSMDFP